MTHLPEEVFAALADDAETLARLHDREFDAPTLAGLQQIGFPDNLALMPQTEAARNAWNAMRAALSSISVSSGTDVIDALAVEYAAIYLTGAYGATPAESPWLDKDRLVCQQPMFELRSIYQANGLAVENWRKRPDDHLVPQLLFVAHKLRHAASNSALAEVQDFLGTHLARWLPDFVAQIATRAELALYPALALLTLAWSQSLMEMPAADQVC